MDKTQAANKIAERIAPTKGGQMIFSEAELSLIKNTFKDNEDLLKLMRKVFLPEFDPKAPLGQTIDLWMNLNLKEMSPEHAHINILARNQMISHLENQLLVLNALANFEKESDEVIAERNAKNSTK
jgi:hypothetical protein